jgi:hypothetical protein
MITHTPDNREIYYLTKGTGPELLFLHGGWPIHFKKLVEVLSPQYSCTTFHRLWSKYDRGRASDRNRGSTQ